MAKYAEVKEKQCITQMVRLVEVDFGRGVCVGANVPRVHLDAWKSLRRFLEGGITRWQAQGESYDTP